MFTTMITYFGFCSCDDDCALFVRTTSNGRILLSLHVDMVIIGL